MDIIHRSYIQLFFFLYRVVAIEMFTQKAIQKQTLFMHE